MDNKILSGKELTFSDLVYMAGNTPPEAKETAMNFFSRMSVSRENSEKAWEKALEIKAKDPHYFEEL